MEDVRQAELHALKEMDAVTAEMVRPLMASKDAETRALAVRLLSGADFPWPMPRPRPFP